MDLLLFYRLFNAFRFKYLRRDLLKIKLFSASVSGGETRRVQRKRARYSQSAE